MKKLKINYTLFILFASAAITTVKAQDDVVIVEDPAYVKTKPTFHVVEIGARFMPTVSSLDVKTSEGGTVEGKATVGYGYGGLLGINFSPYIGIQAEVIYNSISQKYKDQNQDQEITLQYFNVPLLLSLNSSKARMVHLNVVIGPQIGVNVGSELHTSGENGNGNGNGSDSVHAVLAVKKNDLGVAYGVGIGIGLNSSRTLRLDIGFRGVYGFIDISDNSNTQTSQSYYILDRTKIETHAGYIGLTLAL